VVSLGTWVLGFAKNRRTKSSRTTTNIRKSENRDGARVELQNAFNTNQKRPSKSGGQGFPAEKGEKKRNLPHHKRATGGPANGCAILNVMGGKNF